MTTARIICYLFGTLLMITGVYLIGWTEHYLQMIGATAPEGHALSDMRAVFGGLELALGFVILRLARKDHDLPAAALLVFWSFGGLLLGRIYEIIVNGFPEESLFLTVVMIELFGMVGGIQAQRDLARGQE